MHDLIARPDCQSLPVVKARRSGGPLSPLLGHPERRLDGERLILAVRGPLGPIAFLVPGVKAILNASKPEFENAQADDLSAQLRRQRRRLGLTIDAAAGILGVRRWTWGLWESGGQRPHARYAPALNDFLAGGP